MVFFKINITNYFKIYFQLKNYKLGEFLNNKDRLNNKKQ